MSAPFIKETRYEIWRRTKGQVGNFPIIAPTLLSAREEAAYLARGDLLDDKGNRKPSADVFELDPGESIVDFPQDGLFILTVVATKEATMSY